MANNSFAGLTGWRRGVLLVAVIGLSFAYYYFNPRKPISMEKTMTLGPGESHMVELKVIDDGDFRVDFDAQTEGSADPAAGYAIFLVDESNKNRLASAGLAGVQKIDYHETKGLGTQQMPRTHLVSGHYFIGAANLGQGKIRVHFRLYE